MKKILITGGSGLVGRRLSEMLLVKGYEVVHLSRKAQSTIPGVKACIPMRLYTWPAKALQTRHGPPGVRLRL
jgi:nucleoside-diphosphate-sugar epimerase